MSADWEKALLGELADITIGRTPPRNQPAYWTQDLARPFCSIADMDGSFVDPQREGVTELAEAHGKAKRVPAGSLLMSFKLTIGRVGFAARDIFPNEAIARIVIVDPARVDEHYLSCWLEAFDYSALTGRAVKGATLNGKSLRAIPVELPPIAVQRRIADLMATLDRCLRGYAAVEGATAETARALRVRLFADLAANEDSLQRLDEVCTFHNGVAFPIDQQGNLDGQLPFYKVSDMNAPGNERYMQESRNYITEDQRQALGAKLAPAGTVVFPKVGAALLTEKRRQLRLPAAFDNNVMGLVAADGLNCDYLFEFMLTVRLGDIAQQGAVPSVNQQLVGAIRVPIPTPARQAEVATTLGVWAAAQAAARRQTEDARRLRAATLRAALSGNLELGESYDRFIETEALA